MPQLINYAHRFVHRFALGCPENLQQVCGEFFHGNRSVCESEGFLTHP